LQRPSRIRRRVTLETSPGVLAEYPARVTHRTAADWDELARREPHFPVLSSNGIREDAFLATGESDIALLLPAVAALLTIPLARRAVRVVGADVAPSVLEHARKNVRDAGLSNVTFVETHELAGSFDFICSLLVFQHIPPADGYQLIRTLLSLLSPGGVAVLQLMLEPPGGGLRRLARMRLKREGVHRVLPHRMQLPSWMQVNAYDERVVVRDAAAACASVAGRFATSDSGSVVVIEKTAL
jgi:SAM-dependent methyltransferase